MNEAALLSLIVRAGCTMVFVLAMGWAVARASAPVAAVAIAMPVVIGPGFLMLALAHDAPFVMRAAEDSLGALSGTVAFAVVVARFADRLDRAVLLAAALGAWLGVVTLTGQATGLAGNLAAFALVYGGGIALLRGGADVPRVPPVWALRTELPRALAAGALVGVVTLGAARLGPTVSGTLIALPVGMLFVAAGLLRGAGTGAARQIMAAALRGTAALAVFLLVLRGTLWAGLAPVPAILAATVAAVVTALWLGLGGRGDRHRA